VIEWPAIIKHANDPELDYYEDLGALEQGLGDFDAGTLAEDYLIDCSGRAYELDTDVAGNIVFRDLHKHQTLEQVLGLVKAHAAQAESCCVAKLWAPTIRDALSIVRSVSPGDS